ncbi:ABC transporter permease subunit [Paenibacillus sp. MMS20-IR301]|uniref:ABC transporter permease n=1 Tax=Paenibacillus sp. MMS20-IR301 TaxID=2895946 RepID=UPI0028EF546D|nr:ABC transporter permease subunit [Paenibacillus sp. MMS20-IR301]WNS46682.1 ABC transporter permease subunit [Paenibacillus sp. MMS20-IR301]
MLRALNVNRLGWMVSILLAVLVLCPLAAVIIQVLLPGVFFGNLNFGDLSLLLDVFNRPLWRKSLENSLLLGLGTTLLGTVLGTVLAVARSRWKFAGATALDAAAWILFIMPSFILAQGWIMFSAGNGLVASLLGWKWVSGAVFSPAGLIAVMTFSKFPLAYLTVRAAMEWKMEMLSQAARLCGARPLRVWLSIEAPLLLPSICSGALLVFMDTIGDFGLPSAIAVVYRFPTLPYSIYSAIYTSPIRFDMAGVLSLYLVLLILLAIAAQFYILRRSRYDILTGRAERMVPAAAGSYHWLLSGAVALLLIIVIGIPIGSSIVMSLLQVQSDGLVRGNLTLQHYAELFRHGADLFPGIGRSLAIAAAASLIGLIIGLGAAFILSYSRFRFKKAIEAATLISFAVPGVVLGIGYIFVWNQKWLEVLGLRLYGKPSILVLAAIAGAIPVITRVITGSMAKVPEQLLDAAQMQGASLISRMRRILLPLIRGALVSGALAAFGSCVFDLAVNSILFPPNFVTLPIVIDDAFEDMRFGYASAATVTGGGIIVLILILIESLFKRKGAKS